MEFEELDVNSMVRFLVHGRILGDILICPKYNVFDYVYGCEGMKLILKA
jgi:hypothetical protein